MTKVIKESYLEPDDEKPVKRLEGKVQLGLVSPYFIEGMAKVMMFAVNIGKYVRGSWLRGMPYSQAIDATKRHLAAIERGEDRDPETGELHAYHAACDLMFLAHYQENGMTHLDDRLFKRDGGPK